MRKEAQFVLEVWRTANRLQVAVPPELITLFRMYYHITKAELDQVTETIEQETIAHYKDDPHKLVSLARLKEEWKP